MVDFRNQPAVRTVEGPAGPARRRISSPARTPYLLFLAGPGKARVEGGDQGDARIAGAFARQRLARNMLSVGVVEDMEGSIALLCDRAGPAAFLPDAHAAQTLPGPSSRPKRPLQGLHQRG